MLNIHIYNQSYHHLSLPGSSQMKEATVGPPQASASQR